MPGSAAPTVAPRQVTTAFYLFIAAAALSLIALIVSVATIGGTRDAIRRQLATSGQRITESQLDSVLTVSVTLAVVFGVLFIAAYVLFAVFMRRGANWARIVLLVLTVLSLGQIASGFGMGAAQVLVSVIASVLMFLAPANQYFRAVKAAKLARR